MKTEFARASDENGADSSETSSGQRVHHRGGASLQLQDYEWLEKCTTPVLCEEDVFALMATVRQLFEERFRFDRFGILVGRMNDRYCVIHEIVTRDDMEACPAGALMMVRATGLERIYQTGQVHYNPDIRSHPEYVEDAELADIGLRSIVRLPLAARGEVFGVMTVKSVQVNAYSEQDLDLMQRVCTRLAASVYSLKLVYSLKESAYKDSVTGVFNRRFLDNLTDRHSAPLLEEFTGITVADDSAVTVLFADINRFKEYNDLQGHRKGDSYLREIADSIRNAVGEDGFVTRFGGDEFVAVLIDAPPQRVAQSLASLEEWSTALGRHHPRARSAMTIGVGHGVWGQLFELISLADSGMYREKQVNFPVDGGRMAER